MDCLLPALAARIPEGLREQGMQLEPDADDPDRQTLLLQYPAALEAGSYLRPAVKLEFGARSDTEPVEPTDINPYLAEAIPELFTHSVFSVRTVRPERTFWEKVSLIHEQNCREDTPPPAHLARHYYDISRLVETGIAERALANPVLFDAVAAHRAVFFRRSRTIQASLRRGTLRLLPPEKQRGAWRRDYEAMRESMFFGDPPTFDDILERIARLDQTLNEIPTDA